jgi:hypothetical protein
MLFSILCLAAFTGCSRKDAPPAAKSARISATKAFESYFGPAPTTDKGTCYAFAIYFPSAREAGKVVPFPFFSFDEGSLKKVALQRLMGGMDEKSYAGDFPQLFPKGSRLLSLTEQNGVATVNFSPELGSLPADSDNGRALFNAVNLTVLQFAGVKSVRIQCDGRELFPLQQPAPVEASVVLQPSAPRLLKVVAMRDSATAPVEEVDALFDRPVDIKSCRFVLADGTPLAGDVFHAMFDMAAVLKPKEPGKLAPGTKLTVRWEVADKKGRSASGEDSFPLEVQVHKD